MKFKLALLAVIGLSISAIAQTPPPGGVGVVTPTPTSTPTTTGATTSSQWHHYTVNLALAQTTGAGATGTLTLDTLPANSTVEAIIIKPTAAATGGSLTAASLQIRTATGTLHTAVTMNGITPGATVFSSFPAPTAANATVWSSGALSAIIATDATGGPAALTAFAAEVWVKYSRL